MDERTNEVVPRVVRTRKEAARPKKSNDDTDGLSRWTGSHPRMRK